MFHLLTTLHHLLSMVCKFLGTAVVSSHKLGGLNSRNLFSHSLEAKSLKLGILKENVFHASLPASEGFEQSCVFLGLQLPSLTSLPPKSHGCLPSLCVSVFCHGVIFFLDMSLLVPSLVLAHEVY